MSVDGITAVKRGLRKSEQPSLTLGRNQAKQFQPRGEMNICKQSIISCSLQAMFLFLLSFDCTYARAQTPVSARGLIRTADGPQFKWSPSGLDILTAHPTSLPSLRSDGAATSARRNAS